MAQAYPEPGGATPEVFNYPGCPFAQRDEQGGYGEPEALAREGQGLPEVAEEERSRYTYGPAGGGTEVTTKRQQTLAVCTILKVARGKSGKPMALCLADELTAAYRREGASITWRENTHKMAEANKLFAHYAW